MQSNTSCEGRQGAGADLPFDRVIWGLPWWSGVRTLALSLLKLEFNPLVRELKFYRLYGAAKNVTKQIRYKIELRISTSQWHRRKFFLMK